MTHIRDNLYLELESERLRQERMWGDQHHGRFEWSCILGEEKGEADKAANEGDVNGLRTELIQVAAVAMAWVEDIDSSWNGETRRCSIRQAI